MARASGRYFLCDQSLMSFSGHCFAYFEPLARLLKEKGKEVYLIGHNHLDESIASRGVIPGFSYWCDERSVGQSPGLDAEANGDAIRAGHEAVIRADLAGLDKRFAFRAGDRIIINSIRHWAIRGVVDWIDALPSTRRPEVALLLHFTAQPERFKPDQSDRHYREAFRAIERSASAGCIHIFADATTLIDEYAEMTVLDVQLSPFPHSQFKPISPRSEGGPIRVGYVGEARYHKGFHLLPFMTERLNQTDLRGKVEFHFHSFIHNKKAEFYIKSIPHLKNQPNVFLYPDVLSPEEYEVFIQRCDVILIPYMLTYYHSQTSGIYADATGLGIPVVVSRGTWMAKEVKRFGGGALAAPDDYISLADATYHLCTNVDRFRSEARAARDDWCAFNTPGNLVDMFEAW